MPRKKTPITPNEPSFRDELVLKPKGDLGKIQRELRSIRQSPSYILGKHIADSYPNILKIAALPISLPLLAYKILSRKDLQNEEEKAIFHYSGDDDGAQYGRRNSIVFFPTNGVGFGHFTRTLAVARRLKKIDSSLEIVFITTMPTLHPLSEEGFLSYHLPPRYRYEGMEPRVWNSLIEELMGTVLSLHRPKMFIFDGSFPYRGMLNSLKDSKPMSKVWLRRGMFKPDSKPIPAESINHFDTIIRPGDSTHSEVVSEVEHEASIVKCNPITLLDEEDFAPRGELRRRMGIPPQAIVCYLQLGAGRINDISSEIRFTLEALSRHPQIVTVVGESILGDRISYSENSVRILRDYPNSMYFGDFDFAILAGGYNSYHEAIQSSLPTICYPNLKTGTDDQLARAMVAEDAGCMIVVRKRSKSKISAAVDRISDEDVREKMRFNAPALQRTNGAEQISTWILETIANY